MASTKARTSIWAANTLTAGAGDETSSAVDLTDGYGASLNIKITNGATGPTLAAECQIEISADNSAWFRFGGPLVAGTVNAGGYSWGGIDIPIGGMYVCLVAGSNSAQGVTIDDDIAAVTTVA